MHMNLMAEIQRIRHEQLLGEAAEARRMPARRRRWTRRAKVERGASR
jgi:hypothetical protein